jgi:uncharacterized membrane protein
VTSFELLPQLTSIQAFGIAAAIAIGWLIIRAMAGRAVRVARRRSLIVLRAAIFLMLALLFLNPVKVTTTPGSTRRSEMLYLLDSSASMQMGSGQTRWESALELIEKSDRTIDQVTGSDVRMFRFGRRLSAIENAQQVGLKLNATSTKEDTESSEEPIQPVDADSRLLDALRRISSRFGRRPPAGIVLFTDGRVRDPDDVLKLARSFRDLEVPIHVAPLGNLNGGGDVAIVGAVAPRRVRKFSEVEVNVFLRSYGYDGVASSVRLVTSNESGGNERQLPSVPITLRSGFQTVTLKFRSELETQQLKIEVAPQANEIATNNNAFETDIAVDRTKIRVLYVEGSRQSLRAVQKDGVMQVQGPYSDLQNALSQDPDIECVVLQIRDGEMARAMASNVTGTSGFPETQAELLAFDAIFLSSVPAGAFSQQQLGWIDTWIGKRGGGLMMVGGEYSFASGGWGETSVAGMLPVMVSNNDSDWNPAAQALPKLPAEQLSHPVWHLADDMAVLTSAAKAIPKFQGANAGLKAKPGISTTLATCDNVAVPSNASTNGLLDRVFASARPAATASGTMPLLTVGRYGRGRTAAMSVAITRPWASEFATAWGEQAEDNYGQFWRNVVYWLTEASSIGRRRLTITTDKRFYQPGEKMKLVAHAFDERANETQDYKIVAMVEPQQFSNDESDEAPILWPDNVARESGEETAQMIWGEEFTLRDATGDETGFEMELDLADQLDAGSASQAIRFEITAYQDYSQVDSTSLDVQVLHDPYEQQNPFPDHDVLKRLAEETGGEVVATADRLKEINDAAPVEVGEPRVSRQPVWSQSWLLIALLLALTIEWLMRRHHGLA